ncbi:MAG: hypothetical protein ACREDR_42185, partial [Blastocatellia bacterium]
MPRTTKRSRAAHRYFLSLIVIALCLVGILAQGQSTRTFTEWAVPTPLNCPFAVAPSTHKMIFFAESGCNGTQGEVGSVDTVTN